VRKAAIKRPDVTAVVSGLGFGVEHAVSAEDLFTTLRRTDGLLATRAFFTTSTSGFSSLTGKA
jgi:hypothetical protein